MAKIVINEISQNYTYNIGANSYACVAMPITSCWGPAYGDAEHPASLAAYTATVPASGANYPWNKFRSNPEGIEAFMSTYRGPSSNYRVAKDYSYQMAMTLLSAGYDILVCRVCSGVQSSGCLYSIPSRPIVSSTSVVPGCLGRASAVPTNNVVTVYTGEKTASGEYVTESITLTPEYAGSTVVYKAIPQDTGDTSLDGAIIYTLKVTGESGSETYTWQASTTAIGRINISAKYLGSFGNNLYVDIQKVNYGSRKDFWQMVIYIGTASGSFTAVENLSFVLDPEDADDAIPYFKDVESNFVTLTSDGQLFTGNDVELGGAFGSDGFLTSTRTALTNGSDISATSYTTVDDAKAAAKAFAGHRYPADSEYLEMFDSASSYTPDIKEAATIVYKEWIYSAAYDVYDALTDRLTYNPNRVISPGWDDQQYSVFDVQDSANPWKASTLDEGRVQVSPLHQKLMDTAFFSRCATAYIDIPKDVSINNVQAYADMLSSFVTVAGGGSTNGSLYATNSALFAPWGQYKYVTIERQKTASPAFLALMIQRAQILNQPVQYEWALPTNRKHSLKLGKLDYTISNHYLQQWQQLEGVGINAITAIPDLGTNIWGNSTLFDVPPAIYQALANLSTRLLVNAVEDVAFRCGVGITFQYNNEQAYNKFYAGVTPLLDTMKNVGAIVDYYVTMNADINGLDQVNANSIVGKIYLVVSGVVNDIYIDLIALPPSVSLDQFRS